MKQILREIARDAQGNLVFKDTNELVLNAIEWGRVIKPKTYAGEHIPGFPQPTAIGYLIIQEGVNATGTAPGPFNQIQVYKQ